ncbi:MAG: 50S ribosomal protein L23 [bacterium]|nr:50S ribosomal protein L23 [bacterium]
MNIILRKAIISEKAMKQAGQNLYTFLVSSKARKPEIAKAVKEKFGVEVVAVKTVNFKEGSKMQRTRRKYFSVPGYKKALVALKDGQKIALFEAEAATEQEVEPKEEVREKKSLLRGTKVKIEKGGKK